jgi:hypothetical protein
MMKNVFLGLIIILVLIVTSCESDDNIPVNGSTNIQEISNTAQSGNWRISSFIDSGKDETSNFTGYVFNFADNGKINATKGSTTVNGTWSVTKSSSSSSSNDLDFNIGFSSPPDFEELTEDWEVVSYSNNKIDLIHISGGNGGTDKLIFIKN